MKGVWTQPFLLGLLTLQSWNRDKMKAVLRNVAEMTGGGDTQSASLSELGFQVNYIMYMLLITINF